MDVPVPAPGLVALDQAEEGVVFNPGQRLGWVLDRIGVVPERVYNFIFEFREFFLLLDTLSSLQTSIDIVQTAVNSRNLFVESFLYLTALFTILGILIDCI